MNKFSKDTAALALLLWAATGMAITARTPEVISPAQTFTSLYSFCSQAGCTDGTHPGAGLVQGAGGNLYGTTEVAGRGDFNSGTVFRFTPAGAFATLLSFDGIDGCESAAALIQATDANLYGSTQACATSSAGTIFAVTTQNGVLTTLHRFSVTDGKSPEGALIQGNNGNFYGVTEYGGANLNDGTVFKITPSGMLTTLYNFCSQSDCTDGGYPSAGLFQGVAGDFYGTTRAGGSSGLGTVFKMTSDGALTTLHSFDGADGAEPEAGLIMANDGNFYGTTFDGGSNEYCSGNEICGTLFKITPAGALTTLYTFCSQSGCADGRSPIAGLAQGTDGNLYGTTVGGGVNNHGTIFKITLGGTLTTLHTFCSQGKCTDGDKPYAGLVQDTNGTFYGTTFQGGVKGQGTVFSLSVGLGPFVETNPPAGKVGAPVGILGTNLIGATSVTFNGTAAEFTVKSATLIIATVPSGATSGTVQVQLPSGTLSSNVPFIVLP